MKLDKNKHMKANNCYCIVSVLLSAVLHGVIRLQSLIHQTLRLFCRASVTSPLNDPITARLNRFHHKGRGAQIRSPAAKHSHQF